MDILSSLNIFISLITSNMKRYIFLVLNALLLNTSCTNNKIIYPETDIIPVTESYYGEDILDNYRWLEDDMSEKTKDWVERQNKTTFTYLSRIKFREDLKEKFEKIWNYEKLSSPFFEGDYVYYYRNNGLQNQYVLYRKKNDVEEVFLDPNQFSDDGTISLSGMSFSKDGSKVCYSISDGGSDWRKLIVMDTESKEIIEDTLVDIKFSGINWKANEGFFYSSYDRPKKSELSDKTDHHKLYYHKLGTKQKDDKVFFGGKDNEKHRYVGASVTEDDKYLIIDASKFTKGNISFLKSLKEDTSPLIPVDEDYSTDSYLVHSEKDRLFFVTNKNAPNNKVVSASANNPNEKFWNDFIPQGESVLSISYSAGYFFAKYIVDVKSKILKFDLDGKNLGEIELPSIGTARGFSGKKDDKEVYFTFTNYNSPSIIYSLNPKNNQTQIYWKPDIIFDPEKYISKQIFYKSKDGTKIPMTITHKKDIEYNGKNPTILYAYGGFNISILPSFSISNAIWMELGGVYAVPNLRGGGEYGKNWHLQGVKMNKQNVFDDFIAAAEYLVSKKITTSDYLAIRGGSNGGLLVGATMTQRPELMKVAIPAVGVLDMLRYHKFTAGAGWAYDYGTSEESEEMYRYLKKYSPVHNVKDNSNYPATLVTTADHDDRVVPAHSYKFISELQKKHIGDSPVLIRIENRAGHGAGTPVSKRIEQYADIYGFILYNMGYRTLP